MKKKTHAELADEFKKHLEDKGLVAFVERHGGPLNAERNYLFIGPPNTKLMSISRYEVGRMVAEFLRGQGIVKQDRYLLEIAILFSRLVEHRDVQTG